MIPVKRTAVIFLLSSAMIMSSAILLSGTKHNVICTQGRIEVASILPIEQSPPHSVTYCLISDFDSRLDADSFATGSGGEGAGCVCR